MRLLYQRAWSTTRYPWYHDNLKLKFVDIDLKTFNYDLEKLLVIDVTEKTKIIVG